MRREAEECAVLHLKAVLAPILEVAGGRLDHVESPVQILIVSRDQERTMPRNVGGK